MKHKIKGLSGSRPTVSFRCDHCHGGLMASLREAGQSTDCPTCGATIAVPGERELAEWTRHRADEERAADQKKAELGQTSELWCSNLEALAWYVREDVRKRSDAADIQDGRIQKNDQRAANRSWSIDMAGTLIVAAIASLMAFIALPLLIQIERNTRATPAAPQEPP